MDSGQIRSKGSSGESQYRSSPAVLSLITHIFSWLFWHLQLSLAIIYTHTHVAHMSIWQRNTIWQQQQHHQQWHLCAPVHRLASQVECILARPTLSLHWRPSPLGTELEFHSASFFSVLINWCTVSPLNSNNSGSWHLITWTTTTTITTSITVTIIHPLLIRKIVTSSMSWMSFFNANINNEKLSTNRSLCLWLLIDYESIDVLLPHLPFFLSLLPFLLIIFLTIIHF